MIMQGNGPETLQRNDYVGDDRIFLFRHYIALYIGLNFIITFGLGSMPSLMNQ